jgi:phosphatidylinositol-3-phosphatase
MKSPSDYSGEDMKVHVWKLAGAVGLLLALSSCGSSGPGGSTKSGGGGAPVLRNMVIVVLENQDFTNIIGNPNMPFLNGLANSNGLATQYFANTHPSIGNYFMLTTGQIITNDDAFADTVSADNIARELTSVGKSWRVYAESVPGTGYTGDDVYPYLKHHNPFAYFTDVVGTSQAQNIVPFTQLSSDVASASLPNFALVLPNAQNDMHDCPAGFLTCTLADKATNTDRWLQMNLAPLMNSSTFLSNGVLVITFDESETDNTHGGGRVATILVGSHVRPGFTSSTTVQHQSLLRLALESLGVTTLPGASASAASMNEYFQ